MTDRYSVAKRVARAAGELALAMRANAAEQGLKIEAKGLQDFVTEADQQVEQQIRQQLKDAFSNDGFYGEESQADLPQGQGFWVVDPIDGTSNYMRNIDQWAVSIAYVEAGETQLGVVFDPSHNVLYHCQRGAGAYCNEQRRQLDTQQAIDPLLILGHSNRAPRAVYLNALDYLYGKGIEHRKLGSAALGLAQVVSGQCDGYFEADLNPWDCLAGLLLIEEAGGVIIAGNQMAQGLKNGPVAAGAVAQREALSHLTSLCKA
ncbi:MAG: inositol monophosphatase family protein [Pseudomonadales bacterium]